MKIYIVTECKNGIVDITEKETNNFSLFLEKIKNTLRMQNNFTIYATHKNNVYDDILFQNKVIK